jgi:O-succinylbenzoate-CoA ligase
MRNNIGQILTKRSVISPNIEALYDVSANRRFTYQELNIETNKVATALTQIGVRTGDRVGLLLMNSTEFITTFFAIAKLGAVVVPLNWRLVADELEFILKDGGVTVLVSGSEFVDTVAELHSRGDRTDVREWVQVGPADTTPSFAHDFAALTGPLSPDEPAITASDDDLLYIMYTSGTTGLPKGVMHSHNTQLWALITNAVTADFAHGDRYLNPMPMFHVGALTPAITVAYRGLTHVLMRAFDPQAAWELIESERITNSLMVPAMLQFMRSTFDPSRHHRKHLRWILSGGAPVPAALVTAYAEMGVDVHQVYGLTETCGPAAVTAPEDAIRKAGSTGRAFLHTDIKVIRPDGTECEVGESGEVVVAGDHIMLGYWNRPDATAESLRNGWLHTGDVGDIDAEGFVYIKDRVKDMIISGGENVYPAEIENVILSHPEVAEVSVIGIPSEVWGESPLAIVVRRTEALTEREIIDHCNGKLAKFKMPVAVRFIDAIPRNPSGKALKRELRETFPGL